MFGTIRKHQTWLWAIIITLTIISFVIFFSPYSKLNPGQGKAQLGSISGETITEEQFIDAQKEAMLQYFFMSGGRWPEQEARQMGWDAERETYQWLLMLRKVEDNGIHIANDMVAQVARNMISQFQQAGITTPQAFQQQVLGPRGFKLADLERFVRHYLGIQELVHLYGTSGKLITPEEAKALWSRENQELATEAVMFQASNYLTNVNPTPEAVALYYTNHLAEYRIPERLQVRYVEFSASNHLAAAEAELAKTNLTEIVEANLTRMGTNYTQYGKTPDEAKAKIRQEIIRTRALIDARRKANAFANTILEKDPVRLEHFEEQAKAQNLEIKMSSPFDRRFGPPEIEGAQTFVSSAFSLTPTNEPVSLPVVGQNAVYVLAYGLRLPSEVPSLESIRERVVAAYKQDQAASLARQAGESFHQTLTNAMAQGKDFATIVTEAKHQLVTFAPFSISTRTLPGIEQYQINLNELKQVAFTLEPGKVSAFQPTGNGGFILHVKNKLPLDEAKLAQELPNFLNYIRQNRQTEAFNEWFRKEATTGLRDTPLGQPKPPPTMTSAPRAKT